MFLASWTGLERFGPAGPRLRHWASLNARCGCDVSASPGLVVLTSVSSWRFSFFVSYAQLSYLVSARHSSIDIAYLILDSLSLFLMFPLPVPLLVHTCGLLHLYLLLLLQLLIQLLLFYFLCSAYLISQLLL